MIHPNPNGASDTGWRTTELRWFWRGPIPDETRSWFASAWPTARLEEERIDLYLALATDDLSIKLRGDALEAKGRLRALGERAVGPAVGRLEHWVKWTVTRPPRAGLPEPLPGAIPGGWVPVRKQRVLARAGANGGANASAEITSVEVSGRSFWTLAIQAPGESAVSEWAVRDALLHLVSTAPPIPLAAAASIGYAAFLQYEARE